MASSDVFITDTNCITPLGFDVASNWEALLQEKSAIQKRETPLGVDYLATISEDKIQKSFAKIHKQQGFTKLEKLLLLALWPILKDKTITSKTIFVLATTKGNIDLLESQNTQQEGLFLSSLAKKINTFFSFPNEPIVVSNACVSGLMAVSVAKRMMQSGVYDSAVVVAGDIVSTFVLSGFHSFQAISPQPCRPYDKERSGITLGEAAAAAYLTTKKEHLHKESIQICGEASINDANHISGPSRTGEGLYKSIAKAMQEAGLEASQIDYICSHGTATNYNDEMEAIALNRLGLQNTPVHSLKGYYGHTLGASGLLETIIAMECAKNQTVLVSKGYSTSGVSQPLAITEKKQGKEIHYFLKTASGFGGCNTAMVFKKNLNS